jgi:hypothetical protein
MYRVWEMQSTGNEGIYNRMFSIKVKRQDIRFTKQISVTRISIPCFAYIIEKKGL